MFAEKALEASTNGDFALLGSLKSGNCLREDYVDQSGATCVHYAGRSGKIDVLEYLVHKCNFSGDKRSLIGATPAHDAAATGQLAALKWLLQNTECSVVDSDETGATCLHLASRFGHFEIAKWLLEESGNEPIVKTSTGAIPLHFAAAKGDLSIVKLLIEKAPRSVNLQMKNGVAPCYLACQEGHLDVVKYLVLEAGASENLKAFDGMSCFHAASQAGCVPIVEWLVVERGCNVNDCDIERSSALHFASSKGHNDVVKWLLAHGVNINVTDDIGGTPLHDSANSGHIDGSRANSGTPLHDAAKNGHLECVSVLLEYGCDKFVRDNKGLTADELADKCGQKECARLIRNWSARKSSYGRSVSSQDITSLISDDSGTTYSPKDSLSGRDSTSLPGQVTPKGSLTSLNDNTSDGIPMIKPRNGGTSKQKTIVEVDVHAPPKTFQNVRGKNGVLSNGSLNYQDQLPQQNQTLQQAEIGLQRVSTPPNQLHIGNPVPRMIPPPGGFNPMQNGQRMQYRPQQQVMNQNSQRMQYRPHQQVMYQNGHSVHRPPPHMTVPPQRFQNGYGQQLQNSTQHYQNGHTGLGSPPQFYNRYPSVTQRPPLNNGNINIHHSNTHNGSMPIPRQSIENDYGAQRPPDPRNNTNNYSTRPNQYVINGKQMYSPGSQGGPLYSYNTGHENNQRVLIPRPTYRDLPDNHTKLYTSTQQTPLNEELHNGFDNVRNDSSFVPMPRTTGWENTWRRGEETSTDPSSRSSTLRTRTENIINSQNNITSNDMNSDVSIHVEEHVPSQLPTMLTPNNGYVSHSDQSTGEESDSSSSSSSSKLTLENMLKKQREKVMRKSSPSASPPPTLTNTIPIPPPPPPPQQSSLSIPKPPPLPGDTMSRSSSNGLSISTIGQIQRPGSPSLIERMSVANARSMFQAGNSRKSSQNNLDIVAELKNRINISSLKKTKQQSPSAVVFCGSKANASETPTNTDENNKSHQMTLKSPDKGMLSSQTLPQNEPSWTVNTDAFKPEDFKPENFLDEVPKVDKFGREIPQWKRLVLARQITERAKIEHNRKQKALKEAEKIAKLPPWKRDLNQRNDSNDTQNGGEMMEKATNIVPVPPKPKPDNQLDENQNLKPWQRELQNRKQLVT